MRNFTLAAAFVVLLVATMAVFGLATPPSPERAASMAFRELEKAEHLAGVMTIVTTVGASDHATSAPLTLRGAFKVDLPRDGVPAGDMVLRTDATGAGEVMLDARTVGGQYFFKADRLPAGKVGTVDLQTLAGTWWHLDQKTLAALIAAREGRPPAAAPAPTDDDSEDPGTDPVVAWAKIRELTIGGGMFVASPTGTVVEEIAGERAYRQILGVQKEAAKAFAVALREAMVGRALTADEAAEMRAKADTMIARVTVWVTTKNPRIVQAQVDLEDDVSARSVLVSSLDTSTESGVIVPTDAKSFDELGRMLFTQTSATPPSGGPAAAGQAPKAVK